MEIIKSNKGSDKLSHKGYIYVVKYNGKSKITWRCSMKCNGNLYTDLKKENPEVKTGHSHVIDDESVKMQKPAISRVTNQAKVTGRKSLYYSTISGSYQRIFFNNM